MNSGFFSFTGPNPADPIRLTRLARNPYGGLPFLLRDGRLGMDSANLRWDPDRLFLIGPNNQRIFGPGALGLYVDGANGADTPVNGFGPGAAAFKTISYGITQMPALITGTTTLNLSGTTYSEQATLQGLAILGPFSVVLSGTRAADTIGDTTGMTWTNPTGNGSDGYTTVSGFTGLTAGALKNLWLETTSGTGGSPNQVFLIQDNTATSVTLVGNLASTGATLGDGTTHFHIFGTATVIDGGSVRPACVNVQGVQGVTLNQLTLQNAAGAGARCANFGKMNLVNCLVQSNPLNLFYSNLAASDFINGCAILNAAATEVFVLGASRLAGLQQCRLAGTSTGAAALTVDQLGCVANTNNCYVSESGAGGLGAWLQHGGYLQVADYDEFAGCGSHGILNDGGITQQNAVTPATVRFIGNGGWGVLSQNGGQGQRVSGCTYTTNTSGSYSPTTALAGGNS